MLDENAIIWRWYKAKRQHSRRFLSLHNSSTYLFHPFLFVNWLNNSDLFMLHFLERNSRCFVMAKGLRWLVTIARMSRRLPFISHHRHITSSCGIRWDLTAQLDQLPALSRRKLFYQHRRRQIKYLANTTDAKWEKVFFMLSSFSGCDSRWRNGKQRWEAIKKSSFHHKSASAEIFAIPRKKKTKTKSRLPTFSLVRCLATRLLRTSPNGERQQKSKIRQAARR